MTSSYCQPNESPFWFPVAPGIETLPPLPTETVNESPLPANGVVAPEGFDVDNPDLCELFDTILPTNTDPVYATEVTVDTVIPPYLEIVYYDARVRHYLTLQTFPYKIGELTELTLATRTLISVKIIPEKVIIPVKTVITIASEFIDYQLVNLAIKSSITASRIYAPEVLLHLNGTPGSSVFPNSGTLTSAQITGYLNPVITSSVSKFNGTSAYFYDDPQRIEVKDPSLAVALNGPAFSMNGWIYIDPEALEYEHFLYSPGAGTSLNGVALSIPDGLCYILCYREGALESFYMGDLLTNPNLYDELTGKWLYWSIQKRAGLSIWEVIFENFTWSFSVSSNYNEWYNTEGRHSFGGRADSGTNNTPLSLTGAMNEIAIFKDVRYNDFAVPSPLPSEPYDPPSLDYNINIAVTLKNVTVYQLVNIEFTAVIPIYAKLIKKAEAIVRVIRYTGDGTSGRQLATAKVAPSFVWIKNLNGDYAPIYTDSVRGANKYNSWPSYYSDRTGNPLLSFDSEGVTASSSDFVNLNSSSVYHLLAFGNTGAPYVDTSGAMPVTISSNPDFGFSICRWVGIGGDNQYANIPHGLAGIPEIVFVKMNSFIYPPAICGSLFGNNTIISYLDMGYQTVQTSNYIRYTSQYVRTYSGAAADFFNNDGTSTSMYCFRSIPGKTKMGKYTGYNGFPKTIFLDFKPSLVIVRQMTGDDGDRDWMAYSRDIGESWRPFQESNDLAYTSDITLLDNGFRFPVGSIFNRTSQTYYYMAFRDVLAEIVLPSDAGSATLSGTATLVLE